MRSHFHLRAKLAASSLPIMKTQHHEPERIFAVTTVTFDPWPFMNDSVPMSMDVGFIDEHGDLERNASDVSEPWYLTKVENMLVEMSDGTVAVTAKFPGSRTFER